MGYGPESRQAADEVRVEVSLTEPEDSIVGVNMSEPTSVKLIGGGPGESCATFAIDEPWPHATQFIYIRTSSDIKTAGDVKGYSLPEDRRGNHCDYSTLASAIIYDNRRCTELGSVQSSDVT